MTYEQVLDLIGKLSQEVRELRTAQRETDRQIKETDRQIKQTDHHVQETDHHLKETDQRFKETDRYLKETSQQIKETDRYLKENLRELSTQIGGLGNKFGRFAEGLAFPSMEKILRQRFSLETIALRVKRKRKQGDELELDVLAYSNSEQKEVFVIEIKSHLQQRELTQILKTLTQFPEFFPEHQDKKLYGMVVAVDASKEIQQKIIEEGLYLALTHDEQFDLQVPHNFQPRCFYQPSK